MLTKQDVVEQAFSEIGLAAYTYEIQPEQFEAMRRELDGMIAEWAELNINVGFNLGGDLEEDSGLQRRDETAVWKNLAVRAASSYGKVPSNELKAAAANAYRSLLNRAVQPRPRQLPGGVPMGAGRGTQQPFSLPPVDDPLPIDEDGELGFIN